MTISVPLFILLMYFALAAGAAFGFVIHDRLQMNRGFDD